MDNQNSAKSVDESATSENQDKTVDVFFGVFFDSMDASLLANYFNREEYMRKGEETVSDVKDSSVYKTVDEVAAWAKFATDVLPDNPVSKYVKKGLEVKKTAEKTVDDSMGKVNAVNDAVSDNMSKIPTSFGTSTGDGAKQEGDAGESLIGSRSIISKLEPRYIGGEATKEKVEKDYGVKVSYEKSRDSYSFRIYTVGAITHQELKQKNSEEAAQIDNAQIDKAVGDAVNAIKGYINNACPPNQSVHFDIFGYKKDPAVNKFISEIDQFNQEGKVNEISVDHQELYENLSSSDEVRKDLSDTTKKRFRSLDNL